MPRQQPSTGGLRIKEQHGKAEGLRRKERKKKRESEHKVVTESLREQLKRKEGFNEKNRGGEIL